MCRDDCLNLIAYSTFISMLPKVTCRPSTSNTNHCQVDRTSCRCLITIEETDNSRAILHLTIPYLTISVPKVTLQWLTNETILMQSEHLIVLEELQVVASWHICDRDRSTCHQRKRLQTSSHYHQHSFRYE